MKTHSFLGSSTPIEVMKAGHCRVCGHKAIEPTVIVRIDRRWLVIALCLVLYVLFDIAHNGSLDGSVARLALAFVLGPHS
jgi:hypothetical protein